MRWGLLAGLGQGISQGAQLLNQGMQEDRNARREAEREARREAIEAAREKAAESRWRESFEFQKQQAEEAKAFQRESFDFQKSEAQDARAFRESRAKVEDDRYTRSEKRGAIDNEVRFILDDYNVMTRAIAQQATEEIRAAQKEVELLTRAQKSADPMAMLSAEGVNVNPENITGRINALNRQIGAIRAEQKTKLQELRVERDRGLSVIKSHYGDSISKSSFAATLSDLGLPKAEAKEVTEFAFSEFAKGALDDNGDIIAPTGKARGSAGNKIASPKVNQSDNMGQEQAGFGFIPGLTAGYKAATANNGQGLITNLMDQNSQYSPEHTSNIGHVAHPVSSVVGAVAGIGANAFGSVVDAGRVITETPDQRRKRLAQKNR